MAVRRCSRPPGQQLVSSWTGSAPQPAGPPAFGIDFPQAALLLALVLLLLALQVQPVQAQTGAAAYSDDEDEDDDDDDDEDDEHEDEGADRPRYLRLGEARRWVAGYAERPEPERVQEAFVPLALEVQLRMLDVASVAVRDLADYYFYAGFFSSVLTDLPPDRIVPYVKQLAEDVGRRGEGNGPAHMLLIYTAMLTGSEDVVRWFQENAAARLERQPKYAGQPKKIKRHTEILLGEIEQQINENWAVIAAGKWIASRDPELLSEILEALDDLVVQSDDRVPQDAIEEVIRRMLDQRGDAQRFFEARSAPALRYATPQVRRAIDAVLGRRVS